MVLLALPLSAATWSLTAGAPWPTAEATKDLEARGWPDSYELRTYVATVGTSALQSALAVVMLFLLTASIFRNLQTGFVAALVFGFATPAFNWASAFYGHAAAAALLLLGMASTYLATEKSTRRTLQLAAGALTSACLTAATVVDYTAGPAAVVIGLWLLYRLSQGTGGWQQILLCLAAATPVTIAPWLIYNQVTFGAPFKLGYGAAPDFPGLKQGFFGITLPKMEILSEILVGRRRGILQLAPILVFIPVGLALMLRAPQLKSLALVSLGVIAYQLLLNASFFYGENGSSTGPRYLTAAQPFAAIAVAVVWHGAATWLRVAFASLLAISFGVSVLCAMGGMDAPFELRGWLLEYVVERVHHGASRAGAVDLFGIRRRYFLIAYFIMLWAALVAMWRMSVSTAAEFGEGR